MVKKEEVFHTVEVWNPEEKEPWHVNFEKLRVNDDKWSCLVTAAVQSEAQDEECIQTYTQSAATGIRKAIKTISMADVIQLLTETKEARKSFDKTKDSTKKGGKKKENGGSGDNKNVTKKDEKKEDKNKDVKKSKNENTDQKDNQKKRLQPPITTPSEIVNLAAKYATFTDLECQLPPDLMAGVLKYLILNIKAEHYFWKKVEAAKAKKLKKHKIKEKFIKDLKPYEFSLKDENENGYSNMNIVEPIDDEPFGGPDLYIMLVDFYNPFYFLELIKINVPFVAIFKIARIRELGPLGKASHTSVRGRLEGTTKKSSLATEFWAKLKENCTVLHKTIQFKDILMIEFKASMCKSTEYKQNDPIFDELTWAQYAVYYIYRQYQNYLQELYVQRLILSLEPLDLSRCVVYNKLCDATITGEPSQLFLIMYALIEQVVAGVPETENMALEYEPQFRDFLSNESDMKKISDEVTNQAKEKNYILVTPCLECRDKEYIPEDICGKLKSSSECTTSYGKGEWNSKTIFKSIYHNGKVKCMIL